MRTPVTLIRISQIHRPIDQGHQDRPAKDVTERDQREIAERVSDWEWCRGPSGERHADQENVHVGDGMFKPAGDERGDREDGGEDLIGHTPRAHAQPDGQTDQHVAEGPMEVSKIRCRRRLAPSISCGSGDNSAPAPPSR